MDLEKRAPMEWKEFCKSPALKKLKKSYEDDLFQAELKFSQITDACDLRIKEIVKINPAFSEIFDQQIKED